MTQNALIKPQLVSPTALDIKATMELGEIFAKSGMFSDTQTAAQAMVKIMAGQELGLTPIASMNNIHFVQGKPVIGATVIAGLVQASARYDYKILKHDKTECSIQFYRRENGKFIEHGVPVVYTIEDAKAAELAGKGTWAKHPADMLFSSAIRKGARRYCAELFRGVLNSPDTDDYVESETVEVVEAVEAEIIEGPQPKPKTREDYVVEVKRLCQKLNKAGDKIAVNNEKPKQWGKENLHAFINDYFDVTDGLNSLTFADFDELLEELDSRLTDLLA
jgi:tRNA isopentenyl-2-thiomethyl-A-37 hydroxylase MiaE